MYLQKHTAQIAAYSIALTGIFMLIGGVQLPVMAQDVQSEDPEYIAVIYSSRSFPSLSFSSISLSVGYSSQSVSNMSFSSYTVPSIPYSSFSFSQESFSSISVSQFSRSSVSISFTSFSFASTTSATSTTSQASGGSQGSERFHKSGGGTNGGGGGGGNNGGGFGGIIGGGSLGGAGGTVPTPGGGHHLLVPTPGGGGGGAAPRPSAEKAPSETCSISSDKTKRTCIPLLQPLGQSNSIEVKPGAETFIDYFNEAADLLLTISVGFAVLWILVGSYFVMMSGSNGGMRSTGKSMITWAIIGLLIVNFAGFFLRTMNSIFFT